MAKTKKNSTPFPPEKNKRKKKNQVDVEFDLDPPSEDDWVVVKKQRITILIPPLPSKLRCASPDVEELELQPPEQLGRANFKSQATTVKSQSQCSPRISALKQPQSAGESEKSVSVLPPEQTIQPTETVQHDSPNAVSQEQTSLSLRDASGESPSHNVGDSMRVDDNGGAAKLRKQTMIFVDTDAFMDQRMRATHLERKLQRAGGLENWLVSLGLSCFTEVFQRKKVHKFHLARLTMKKLKDMGVHPVGPRRKLIHAIDCLCEPHCFQHM